MTPAFDRDTLALYVLGALEPEETAAIDAALASGDPETLAAVAEARRLAASVGASAPETPPPAGAADRLLARLRREGPSVVSRARAGGAAGLPPRPRPRWFAPALVTAMFVILAGFSVLNTLSDRRIDDYVVRVAKVSADPRAVRWTLRGTADRQPLGVVWFDPAAGEMLVTAADLPKAPAGKTYVLWTIGAGGAAPVNRGALRPSLMGPALVLEQAPAPDALTAVAVSLETDPAVRVPVDVRAQATGGG